MGTGCIGTGAVERKDFIQDPSGIFLAETPVGPVLEQSVH